MIGARCSPSRRRIDLEVLEEAFDRAIRVEARGLENPFRRSFVLKMPPRPKRDDILLLPAKDRSKAKSRKARKLELTRVLTKA